MKFYKIANATVRPLQYKNCYNWVLVAELENGTVYYHGNASTIVKASKEDAISLHKQIVSQKPVAIKAVNQKELWGAELGILLYAIENNLSTTHYDFSNPEWQEVIKNAPKFKA